MNAIYLAAGADLLNLYGQSDGQAPAAVENATAAALKAAIAVAKMNESMIASGESDTGTQLNVFA